ncbi:rRNA methyltransferase-like protein 1 [Elsinoe australis]|uniref:rRNA methyltransferase 2, mitochondrial n=1 Tax=Elsinoe australis TaxID=40998 RepID=A0A4U7AYL5_9PEZI|nr:rRNA methyltransferase-like protein 1 [Elsinoe australis]
MRSLACAPATCIPPTRSRLHHTLIHRHPRELTPNLLHPRPSPPSPLHHTSRPLPPPPLRPLQPIRPSSSSSSTRWKTRQSTDLYAAKARTSTLKSRAAYKLLELDQRHRLFKPGQTVIDLGFAPGAWSQVAEVRGEVRRYVRDWGMGRAGVGGVRGVLGEREGEAVDGGQGMEGTGGQGIGGQGGKGTGMEEGKGDDGRVVDVVLSDMSAPWPLSSGSWIKSVSNPYFRMMNTSGVSFRDHAGSMDLCLAALTFCFDTLVPGGHFVCKFYQGAEDKSFELRLKKLFEKVVREKPDASRKESKEAYFVALRRKPNVERPVVFPEEAEENMT